MRIRNDKELKEEIDKFVGALKEEFEGEATLNHFSPILDKMCRDRLERFIENRLGHLKNPDFFLLSKMVFEEVNLYAHGLTLTPAKEVIQPPEPVVTKPTFEQQMESVMAPKARGRPKKS